MQQGMRAMAGAFEAAYVDAPPETLSTSTTAGTSMALAVALGFLAAALFTPTAQRSTAHTGGFPWLPRQRHGLHESSTTPIDELMENKR